MWLLEQDRTILRGVVQASSNDTVIVFVDGYPEPYEYKAKYVFKRFEDARKQSQRPEGFESH